MDEVTPKTAEEFGFAAKSVRKLKYMYICRGEKETRIIKKTSLSEDEIMLVYRFKKYLFENGFTGTDKYFLSNQGVPYFNDGENTYIMTDFASTVETSFASADNFIRIVKAVAEFHRAGKNFTEIEGGLVKGNILNEFERDIKKLTAIRKAVRNKKHISDYDVMFVKNYDSIFEKAKRAYETVKKLDISDTYTVCHNSLKEETVSVSGSVFITGMDTLSRDSFVKDLADIIERYMRKRTEKYVDIEEIIKVYSEINHISHTAESLLYALLLFPKGYIKASRAIYSKNRSWVPIGTVQRFNSMLALQMENEKYISPIKFDLTY